MSIIFTVVVTACSGGATSTSALVDTVPPVTTAKDVPAPQATTTSVSAGSTTEAPAAATTEPAPATTTTTTVVEAVEVSVLFSELSDQRQAAFTAAICAYATDPDPNFRETFPRYETFDQMMFQVISGFTGIPELGDAWSELSAGADRDAFRAAAVPICVAIGWTPDS